MGYHPRIESRTLSSFLTTRTRNSELWFANNPKLEESILGFAAKYATRYEVTLYALAIEGNHVQGPALFPKGNRAGFMRDFNSSVARAVARYTPEYSGGRLWARRYSAEFLPGAEDIFDRFFYTVLQPVQDGLVERLSDYPFYNCFHDAAYGRERKLKSVRWGEYNAALRDNSSVSIADFTEIVVLKYARLPGYEHLSQREYAKLMLNELEMRRVQIVRERYASGKGFLGREKLLQVRCGSLPMSTKTSTIDSHRPRVLSVCPERRAQCNAWYFSMYFAYREASRQYRSGNLTVEFPDGMYPPSLGAKFRELENSS